MTTSTTNNFFTVINKHNFKVEKVYNMDFLRNLSTYAFFGIFNDKYYYANKNSSNGHISNLITFDLFSNEQKTFDITNILSLSDLSYIYRVEFYKNYLILEGSNGAYGSFAICDTNLSQVIFKYVCEIGNTTSGSCSYELTNGFTYYFKNSSHKYYYIFNDNFNIIYSSVDSEFFVKNNIAYKYNSGNYDKFSFDSNSFEKTKIKYPDAVEYNGIYYVERSDIMRIVDIYNALIVLNTKFYYNYLFIIKDFYV